MESFLLFSLLFFTSFPRIASSVIEIGNVLKVGNNWTSPQGSFALGFLRSKNNGLYNLSIWYEIDDHKTVVWTATSPENGYPVEVAADSELHFKSDTGLTITFKSETIWRSNQCCVSTATLQETGNLVVRGSGSSSVAWQSFDFPTSTILPEQQFQTKANQDPASLSSPSRSYGLHINRAQVYLQAITESNRYWYIQNPSLNQTFTCLDDTGRQVNEPRSCQPNAAISSGVAVLNLSSQGMLYFSDATGQAWSSPDGNPAKLYALDYEDPDVLWRRLTLEDDGNLRIYSFVPSSRSWRVSWQALLKECDVFGICGAFGLCTYRPHKTCSCPPGFHHRDPHDDSKGCDYDVPLSPCDSSRLVLVNRADYYYNDYNFQPVVYTLDECKAKCLSDCKCLAAAYTAQDGASLCFLKGQTDKLYNGMQSLDGGILVYIKISSADTRAQDDEHDFFVSDANSTLSSRSVAAEAKSYLSRHFNGIVAGIAMSEFVLFVAVLASWFLVYGKIAGRNWEEMMAEAEGAPARFTYKQLEEATGGFRESLGSGGCGVVYKGDIPDKGGAVAVKVIKAATQAEKQFKAEVATIGRIHHVNLVRLLGYCVEGDHRLLVYEYMPNGSLDTYLFENGEACDWKTRMAITVGIARGIAYLHEECRECILHCDIKPQNVLLDENMSPKIADFGLAKLLSRDASLAITTIRGTRGYVAPEWLDGQSITPKVDVYSFGMLLLDILCGCNKFLMHNKVAEETEQHDLPTWAFHRFLSSGIKSIADPQLESPSEVDWNEFETLFKVALWCTHPDSNYRPAMSSVVRMVMLSDVVPFPDMVGEPSMFSPGETNSEQGLVT